MIQSALLPSSHSHNPPRSTLLCPLALASLYSRMDRMISLSLGEEVVVNKLRKLSSVNMESRREAFRNASLSLPR